MIAGRKYTPSSIVRLLWAGKVIILTAGAIAAGGTAWYVSRIPTVYRSGATILVMPQVVPQNFVRSTVTLGLEDRLRSLSDRALANDALGQLAAELKVYPELGTDQKAMAQQLRSRIRLDLVRSDAFRVTFMHRNAVTAARVADRLAKIFVEADARERTGLAEETNRFVDEQLQRTRDKLTEHEAKLEEYRRTYSGELPTEVSTNLQVIETTQNQLRALADVIHQERDQKLRLEEALASLPPAADTVAQGSDSEPPQAFDPLVDDAAKLEGRDAAVQLPRVRTMLRSMELQLKPDHPDIVRLKRIIGELERRAGDSTATDGGARAGNSARAARVEQLRAELDAVERRLTAREAEEKQLRDRITRYQQRVEMVPTRETELTTLMRDYDTLRESYRSLLTKKEESQMAADLERQKVGATMKIVDPARVPDEPYSLKRRRTTFFGLLAGFGIGLLVVGIREIQDGSLRTEAEVLAELDVPVIALIPVIHSVKEEKNARLRTAVIASAACLLVVAAVFFYLRSGLAL